MAIISTAVNSRCVTTNQERSETASAGVVMNIDRFTYKVKIIKTSENIVFLYDYFY